MSSSNISSSEATATKVSLLWMPHALIAVSFLVFLGFNFWCYHKKYRERYQRKTETFEMKERLRERRRILNIVKLRYMVDPMVVQRETAITGMYTGPLAPIITMET